MKKQMLMAAFVGWVMMVAAPAFAVSVTVATFSDPSSGSGTPLFTYTQGTGTTANPAGSILTGGWSSTGLTLHFDPMPHNFNNVTFSFNPASMTATGGACVGGACIVTFGSGSFTFLDSSNNPLLSFAYNQATLTDTNFGATTTLSGTIVQITGFGALAGYTFSNPQAFAFSFANQVNNLFNVLSGTSSQFTSTAAFTSSATVTTQVPEPSTLLLLGAGLVGLAFWGRKRISKANKA